MLELLLRMNKLLYYGLIACVGASSLIAEPTEEKKQPIRQVIKDVKELPADVIGITKKVATPKNLGYIAGTAALVGVSSYLDDDVRDFFQDEHPLKEIEGLGNHVLARTDYHYKLAFASYTFGTVFDNPDLALFGKSAYISIILNKHTTCFIKEVSNRKRPDGDGGESLISGHTSGFATLMGVLVCATDNDPKIAIPAYIGIGLVGASRLETDAHHLSDVLGGGAVGFGIGYVVTSYFKDKEDLMVVPVIDNNLTGVAVIYDF